MAWRHPFSYTELSMISTQRSNGERILAWIYRIVLNIYDLCIYFFIVLLFLEFKLELRPYMLSIGGYGIRQAIAP